MVAFIVIALSIANVDGNEPVAHSSFTSPQAALGVIVGGVTGALAGGIGGFIGESWWCAPRRASTLPCGIEGGIAVINAATIGAVVFGTAGATGGYFLGVAADEASSSSPQPQ